jgi:four helix bundle protein
MQDFHKLRVRHHAREVTRLASATTHRVRERDSPGIRSQLRRAAALIGANIAEGSAHHAGREFARSLQQALASADELMHRVITARDVGMLAPHAVAPLIAETSSVQRMLVVLHRRVLEVVERRTRPSTDHHR